MPSHSHPSMLYCPSLMPPVVVTVLPAWFLAMTMGILTRVVLDALSPVEVHDAADHRRTFTAWLATILITPGIWTVLELLPKWGPAPPPGAFGHLMELAAASAGLALLLRATLRLWVPLAQSYDESDPYYQGVRKLLNREVEYEADTSLFGSYPAELAMQKLSRGVGTGYAYGAMILGSAMWMLYGADCP